MRFEEWVKSVSGEITGDSLWKMEAYRLALFAADLGWRDVTKLTGDRRTLDIASQLYRALGSIEANISEGYSRGSGRDRARFYEYALGSARESRGWYYKGRHVLGDRKSVVEGKRVDLGGRRIIKKKKKNYDARRSHVCPAVFHRTAHLCESRSS